MKKINNPKVILVGAGPGDPKLITIAGVEALKKANVVLYDALVNPELLRYAHNAELIFVGKRKGNHRFSQEEINKLIVQKAFESGTVVRLKGGDPFVFGRGAEELKYIDTFGIETESIPGISSATSVPSRMGISLTERNTAESFWVVTGTTSSREFTKDLKLAAQSSATIVVLMGMSNLSKIVLEFKKLNRGETPVAVIQNGFMEGEKTGVGKIDTIEEIVKNRKLSNPAIIVIGEVVSKSHRLEYIYKELEEYYLKSNK